MGFKCCKTRSLSYYVCKNCFQMFHKSCLLRMSQKKIQHFADNVIICCHKEENGSETNQEKSYLEETIMELEDDNSLKAKHIEMLKKNNSILLQEAMETENDLRNMIANREEKIETLRKEIEETTKKLLELENKESSSISTQTSINTSDSHTQTLENSISTYKTVYTQTNDESLRRKEAILVNEHQVSEDDTIISLDNELSQYLEISADDQYLLLNQSSDRHIGQQLLDQPNVDQQPESDSRRKILITGDEFAKSFVRDLELVMENSNLIIDKVVKPKSELNDLTKDLFSKVMNYNSNDFVIIMFNTKNVSNNISLRYAIKNMLPISKFTNLIIMSERSERLDQILIKHFVRRISKFRALNKNCSLNFFVDKGGKENKRNLITEIQNIIKYPRTNSIVLKSVNMVGKYGEIFFRE